VKRRVRKRYDKRGFNLTKRVSETRNGRPKISASTQLKLWVRASGQCEMFACNEDLFRDGLTLKEANYSNIGHIVSWSPRGPRGNDPLPLSERNKFENLMLVCTKHHSLIDSQEHTAEYPKEILHQYKRWHEDRIALVTQYQPEHKTTIVRMKSYIGDEVVGVSMTRIRDAIAPRYPADLQGLEIDLTAVGGAQDGSYHRTMARVISNSIVGLHAPGVEAEPVQHVSVFALGPIPLLVHLGHCLSNKITCDLYQRHRDTEDWQWKSDGDKVRYKVNILRRESKSTKVALLLSLSGSITQSDLPDRILRDFAVYEITLDGQEPSTAFLRRREDLEAFKSAYRALLRRIRNTHGPIKEIHLFPAVPAPVAVVCGRETLRKVDPSLLVYDFDKNKGGFKLRLKVN
jgi:SMODS-associated and fused to various effectors sensor domain